MSGQLIAPTIGPTRTEQDFVEHIARTVATDPQAKWIFIVDRLNIHQPAGLVEWVAEQCHLKMDLGKKRKWAF